MSTLIAGFGDDKEPHLCSTDPSGNWAEWRANCIGHNSKVVSEFLEKNYPIDQEAYAAMEDPQFVKLAVRALLEVVESKKNIEVAVVRSEDKGIHYLSEEEIGTLVDEVEKEKEEATEKLKRQRLAQQQLI